MKTPLAHMKTALRIALVFSIAPSYANAANTAQTVSTLTGYREQTTFYILKHPEWLKWGDWLLGALAGAIATILLQALYDLNKEHREIKKMRDAIYESLA
jgi:hypothetical protein